MREMAQKYGTVLVVGGEGDKCRAVAEGYGFKDVVTPGDIIKDNKDTTPFRKLTDDETNHSRARNFGEAEIEGEEEGRYVLEEVVARISQLVELTLLSTGGKSERCNRQKTVEADH